LREKGLIDTQQWNATPTQNQEKIRPGKTHHFNWGIPLQGKNMWGMSLKFTYEEGVKKGKSSGTQEFSRRDGR